MQMTKELVLFIPGISANNHGEYLGKLLAGIENYCQGNEIKLTNFKENEQFDTLKKIEIIEAENRGKRIDFKEIYWGDLKPNLSEEKSLIKMIRGFDLLTYWAFSKNIWHQAKHSKFLIINTVVTLLILCLWYVGIFSLGLQAISGYFSDQLPVPQAIKSFGAWIAGYKLWLPTTILMAFIPINSMVNAIHTAKSYIQNRNGFFHNACGKIRKEILTIVNSAHGYDKITVLSHSFGVVLATEVLAELEPRSSTSITKISMGGPLKLICAKSDRVAKAVNKICSRPFITEWLEISTRIGIGCAPLRLSMKATPNIALSPSLLPSPWMKASQERATVSISGTGM
ncbi:MAG: hypothetical protein GY799_24310 [Desulfobulbaceae bacterium]|nr:hypothetical protein [Desulfobulbaceae bacterium]